MIFFKDGKKINEVVGGIKSEELDNYLKAITEWLMNIEHKLFIIVDSI